jgi:hypothetical protein
MNTEWLTHPAALGLYAGLLPALVFRFQLFLSRRDLHSTAQAHLSQIKALTESAQKIQSELQAARAEHDHLRVKIQSLLQSADRQKLRQLEVLLRAEQRLTLTAPGFAPAWQTAKNEASVEIEAEEQGKSAPKQMFSHVVQTGSNWLSKLRSALPDSTKPTPTQEPPTNSPQP